MIRKIIQLISDWYYTKKYRKRIKEIKKKDPFIYNTPENDMRDRY